MPVAAANVWVCGVAFAVYTLLIIAVGLYATRFARAGNEDYFLAGRTLGPWVAALSASASAESGWVTLGLVGTAFAHGVQAYWIIPGVLIGFLFDWFVMAGPMSRRAAEMNAVTLPDFLALSFRERYPLLRTLSVIVILASMMAYVAGQFAAAGKAFQAAFGMQYGLGVLVGAGIVLVYTVTGGFRAVCWTDYLQALFMVGALLLFPIYLLAEYGGFEFVRSNLAAVADPGRGVEPGDLTRALPRLTGLSMLGFLLGSRALGINLGYPGQPHIVVRFMAMRDPADARRAGVISGVWTAMVFWGAITTGLIARAACQADVTWAVPLLADQESALVAAAMNVLPGVLAGVVLAAVLSAICSTADSQLVVAASAAANDLYARVRPHASDAARTWINRLVVLALGAGAVLLVIDQRVNVYRYVLDYAWAMLGASFGPQLILLLLWRRASYAGCVAGMAAGFAAAVVWPRVYDARATGVEVYNLTLAFALALIVNVVLSVCAPRPLRNMNTRAG